MRTFAIVSLLAAVATAQRTCGSMNVPGALKEDARAFNRANHRSPWVAAAAANRTLEIDTYFHIVASDETEENGWLPDAKIKSQFDEMNKHYRSTGISFKLIDTTKTVNKEWATFSVDGSAEATELEMKKKLRKGGYDTLNIYFRPLADGLLGICVFPEAVEPDSDTFWLDGCQVLHSSVPGGGKENYDKGATCTHEVGHWLGLFHTFQDGCDGGDQVDDTPAQADPTNGCPKGKDTCSGTKYPGKDPIENFMDYSYDSCMTHFSAGQATRIFQFWDKYRSGNSGNSTLHARY